MSGKLAGSLAVAAILAAGAGAMILGGKMTGGGDGGVVPVPEEIPVKESQLCQRAVRASKGKLVRIVGVAPGSDEEVKDTEVGRVVEVAEVPDHALCHVVLDARPVARSQLFSDGNEYVGNTAQVEDLKDCLGEASWPVSISGSCNGVGSCMWSVLFRGECCRRAADSPQYVGSTLKEFLALPVGIQRRFLRVRGKCVGDEGEEVGCSVPIGDPRAVAGAEAVVYHSWSKRTDLNYVRGEWDEQAGRYEPRPRHEAPEGVGGPEVP